MDFRRGPLEMAHELVAEKVEVHPVPGTSALRASQQLPIERPCLGQIAHRNGQMKWRKALLTHFFYSTLSTLMKFVLPETWSGTPPVMTTCWPAWRCPALRAAWMENRIKSSMLSDLGISIGTTPHARAMKSRAWSLGVVARIGCFGRKRDTRLAVDPDHVGVMIAPASISLAM